MKLCKDCVHWSKSETTDKTPYGFCKNPLYSINPVYGWQDNNFIGAYAVRHNRSLCGIEGNGWVKHD